MANWRHTSPTKLLESHLRRTPGTARAYRGDLAAFAKYVGARSMVAAVKKLVGSSRGEAKRVLDDWLEHHREAGLSLAYARRRVSSLLSLLSKAADYDVIGWVVRMRLPTPTPVRDVRGPDRDAVYRMLHVCEDRDDSKGLRDRLIIYLLYFVCLRSREVLSLDVSHVDLEASELIVHGKGKWDRSRIPMVRETRGVMEDWLSARGESPGPLLTGLCPTRKTEDGRLSYRGLYETIRKIGQTAGIQCHPHALRHGAATEMSRLSNGSHGWVLALTRHRDPRMVMTYDDTAGMHQRSAQAVLLRGQCISGAPPDYRRC